jgi:hypothetical protein
MKKITLNTLLVLVIALFSIQLSAQNTYTYTLIDNGGYNFTIAAVADAGGTNEVTEVQSYGFTILLPDTETMTITSSLGPAPTTTPLTSANVTAGDATITGYQGFLITEVLGATVNLPNLPATGLPNMIATIQVNGAPIAGEIRIVANDSTLDGTYGNALEAFLTADTSNTDSFDPTVLSSSGLSGSSFFNFSVLGTNDVNLVSNKFSLYPNPSSDTFSVAGLKADAKVSIYSISGREILSVSDYSGEAINISALTSGVYLVSIESEASKEVKRLVIQ